MVETATRMGEYSDRDSGCDSDQDSDQDGGYSDRDSNQYNDWDSDQDGWQDPEENRLKEPQHPWTPATRMGGYSDRDSDRD
uniref:RNA-binding protein 33 n=1 Tax=Caenorhabditis tropicalis TaxID=1561998 RepID=A0A1I7V211_9PELO